MSKAPERIWTIDTGWSGSWTKEPYEPGTEYVRADLVECEWERITTLIERIEELERENEHLSAAIKSCSVGPCPVIMNLGLEELM